jgi:hypothetical protein
MLLWVGAMMPKEQNGHSKRGSIRRRLKNVKRGRIFRRAVPIVACATLFVVLDVFTAPGARAQDVFSSRANAEPGGNSGKTGTQGVNGNPFCPPPVIIINGVPTTPRNWSCRGDAQTNHQTPPHAPPDAAHAGQPKVAGPFNPCQPSGPGGYNYLDNPVGTRLPPGCARPSNNDGGNRKIITSSDPYFESLPRNVQRPAPTPYGRTDPNPESRGQTQNYRKPPMPQGQISSGYDSAIECYRKPDMPKGQISPGYDAADQGYRKPPMPKGQISPGYDSAIECYRKPDMPKGQIAPGYDPVDQGYRKPDMPKGQVAPGYDPVDQGYRKPPMPKGQIAPGYDAVDQGYRKPDLPKGQIAPGYDAGDQSNRKPPVPKGQVPPVYDFTVQIYR